MRQCDGPLPASDCSDAVLEFYNPHLFECLALDRGVVPLDRDLTAPYAFAVKESPHRYLEGFLAPFDTQTKPKLLMLEPYQQGKIPVVLIHGLLSEPMAWVDAVNELRAQPDLYRRFQFWAFRYPTGVLCSSPPPICGRNCSWPGNRAIPATRIRRWTG